MAHTFTSLHYHAVFSTKGRANLIPQDNLARVHAYLAGIIRNIGGEAVTVGGTTDHAHLLFALPTAQAVAQAMNVIKSNSSLWAKTTFPTMASFAWQEGYGAFAVSKSNVEAVAAYVAAQEKHHQTMSFEDEFLALLDKHGIEYDRRFVLD
jgi:REP element-mobilizing transposase RayT